MELDLPRLMHYFIYFRARLTLWFLRDDACRSLDKILMNMKVNHIIARALVKILYFQLSQ